VDGVKTPHVQSFTESLTKISRIPLPSKISAAQSMQDSILHSSFRADGIERTPLKNKIRDLILYPRDQQLAGKFDKGTLKIAAFENAFPSYADDSDDSKVFLL